MCSICDEKSLCFMFVSKEHILKIDLEVLFMKVQKRVISNLNKCYAMSRLTHEGQPAFLVAAEKHDPCYLFNEEGEMLDTVWTEPGGVMTMTPVPGTEDMFLATHKFYSPNDSKEAKIVIAKKEAQGWSIRTLCDAPFVHRFGILNRNGVNYLIVCCLKSGHEYKDDWRMPGACYGAILPEDLSSYNEANQLKLTPIKIGMLKNHGYSQIKVDGYDAAVVGCEEGVFVFAPPAAVGEPWTVKQVLSVPTSDAVLMDFDGDGKLELGAISPFHGASLVIYHLDAHGNYVPQWKFGKPEKETDMIHATWACQLLGKPTWIVGWRKGTKDTIAITWDGGTGDYHVDYIDRNTGCANAMHFVNAKGQDVVVGTNREIDEVAMYIIEED